MPALTDSTYITFSHHQHGQHSLTLPILRSDVTNMDSTHWLHLYYVQTLPTWTALTDSALTMFRHCCHKTHQSVLELMYNLLQKLLFPSLIWMVLSFNFAFKPNRSNRIRINNIGYITWIIIFKTTYQDQGSCI